MSRSSWITLRLHRPRGVSRVDVVRALLAGGWRAGDEDGGFIYLPLGDKDDFDWESAPLAELDRVLAEMQKKERAGEVLGLGVSWADTGIGGSLVCWTDDTISLSTNADRRTIGDTRITDVSWYVPKLVAPVESMRGVVIEALEWTETI
jgi:hypothetical protein